MRIFLLSLVLAACTGSEDKVSGDDTGAAADDSGTADSAAHDSGGDDTAADDTGGDSGGDDTGTPTLYGTVPEVAIAAPEFNATNRDETARSQPDLIGNPHVLWFYPAAFTGG